MKINKLFIDFIWKNNQARVLSVPSEIAIQQRSVKRPKYKIVLMGGPSNFNWRTKSISQDGIGMLEFSFISISLFRQFIKVDEAN